MINIHKNLTVLNVYASPKICDAKATKADFFKIVLRGGKEGKEMGNNFLRCKLRRAISRYEICTPVHPLTQYLRCIFKIKCPC